MVLSPPKAKLEVGALSETGFVRNENQDRMSGSEIPLGHLYIVADGMGGHKGGAMAAELTVKGLQKLLGAAAPDASVEKVLRTSIQKVNEAVYRKAHSGDSATENMGSTVVMLLVADRTARLAHVGDSRAYLYRRGRLKLLTKDHTVVQKMVEAGMLKPAEAIDHPNASVLERAVGSKPGVEADIGDKLALVEGDAILLCSDGLSGYVPDPAIEKVLRSPATVQAIPEQLMDLAMQAGGEDNVTVQFIQYGQRKEALSKMRATQNLAITKPDRSRPAYITTAAVLLLFAAFGAVAHTYVARKLKAIENQMIAAKDKFENNANNLIERVQGSTIQIKDLQKQLAALTESSNSLTVTLTGKLEAANAAEVEAAKQASELQNKSRMAGDAKDKAERLASQLDQQLRTANAEKKKTRFETDKLLDQLKAAETEISNLQAELKKAKPIDAEESIQPTDQEQ